MSNDRKDSTSHIQRPDQKHVSGPYTRRLPDDYVPFQGTQSLPHIPSTADSTLTESEKRTFERLHGLIAKPQPQVPARKALKRDRQDVTSQLDAILDDAMRDVSGMGEGAPSPFNASKQSSRLSQAKALAKNDKISVRERQKNEFDRIAAMISAAETDMEVWGILQDQIFPPVKALNLEEPVLESKKQGPGKTKQEERIEMAVVGHIFPDLLLRVARRLRHDYPSSPLLLSIIPELRAAGPTAFALGATTDLYNESLTYLGDREQDISAVLDLLNEMERDVVEPDRTTLAILYRAIGLTRKLQKGAYGGAVKSVWTTDRKRRAFAEASASYHRIKQKLGPAVSAPGRTRGAEVAT